ncbi:MAG: P-II family nitrogen regulator [Telluria sp.]
MKEIKAYVHSNRVADVIAALKACKAWGGDAGDGQHNLTAYVVKGSLLALDNAERHYSVDLGAEVINEYKLEFLCEDMDVDELVSAIRTTAQTGQPNAGWVTVTDITQAVPIP